MPTSSSPGRMSSEKAGAGSEAFLRENPTTLRPGIAGGSARGDAQTIAFDDLDGLQPGRTGS
ncbi:MAG: hypothetical protein ACLVEJ_01870 [Parabacteroides sp.]